jgi:hypothetical protein
MIQVASEDTITLFHIGRHHGKNPEDLLAPSLRALIENPSILKTGPSIMGDFWRLNHYFGLEPKSALELSYLHRLIDPERVYTTKYVRGGLKWLVSKYFPGLTLYKDKDMHEGWLAPLSTGLRLYAAADAYAGLMLFCRMNAKRLDMRPSPPLPACSEAYTEYSDFVSGAPLLEPRMIKLRPVREAARGMNVVWFSQ